MSFAFPGDWAILLWIQEYMRTAWLDVLVPFYSSLGNGGMLWIAIAIVFLFNKRYRYVGVAMLCGLALGWLVGNSFLKPLIARPRPCWLDPSVALLIPVPQDYSFPSGHTLSSVIAATVLWWSGRRWLGVVGILLAGLMTLSRLYLFVHFPSDILAGIILGVLIGSVVSYFCYKKEKNIKY